MNVSARSITNWVSTSCIHILHVWQNANKFAILSIFAFYWENFHIRKNSRKSKSHQTRAERCGAQKWKSLGLFMICIPNEVESMHSTHTHTHFLLLPPNLFRFYFIFYSYSNSSIFSFFFFKQYFYYGYPYPYQIIFVEAKLLVFFFFFLLLIRYLRETRLWRILCLRCLQWAAMMLLHSAGTCFCWCMYSIRCDLWIGD